MFPIHLREGSHGIGMDYREFIERFYAICQKHMDEKRAKSFAFIFCNMGNGAVIRALDSQQGFTTLNTASDHDMTVFYLHAKSAQHLTPSFNSQFLNLLNVADQAVSPCIVFFEVYRDSIENVEIQPIDDRLGRDYLIIEQMRRLIAQRINSDKQASPVNPLAVVVSLLAFVSNLRGAIGF